MLSMSDETKTIYLRVDVDFNVGLKKGVPVLIDLFSEKEICREFFGFFVLEGLLI